MPKDSRYRKNGVMAKSGACNPGELELGLYLLGKISKPGLTQRKLTAYSPL